MENQNYDIKLRILGNEILGLTISTTSNSNKWIAISIATMFCILTIIGAYGDKFIGYYHSLNG